MNISSHRGKIVLDKNGNPNILFVMHMEISEPAVAIRLRRSSNAMGRFRYFVMNPDSIDDLPQDKGLYRENFYLVAHRTRNLGLAELGFAEEPLLAKLHAGGMGTEDGYISVITGYNMPKHIVLPTSDNMQDILTFYVSAVTPSMKDPDGPNQDGAGAIASWPNAQLELLLNEIAGEGYDSTKSQASTWQLYHASVADVLDHSSGQKHEATLVAQNNTGSQLLHPQTPGNLGMGMYILAVPKPVASTAN